jgi:hypothetical protein
MLFGKSRTNSNTNFFERLRTVGLARNNDSVTRVTPGSEPPGVWSILSLAAIPISRHAPRIVCAGTRSIGNQSEKADFDRTKFARHVLDNQLQMPCASFIGFLKSKIFKSKPATEPSVLTMIASGRDVPKASRTFQFRSFGPWSVDNKR